MSQRGSEPSLSMVILQVTVGKSQASPAVGWGTVWWGGGRQHTYHHRARTAVQLRPVVSS